MTTLEHYDRAMRLCADDIPRWRALNRAAAAIREGAPVYNPYRFRALRIIPWKRLALRLARGRWR